MYTRELKPSDLDKIRELHEKFFAQDFKFPDFYKFVGSFGVFDDDGEVILAGGVKPILESILITNKDKSTRARREALIYTMRKSMDICEHLGHNQLHCFITDPAYGNQLKRNGFNPIIGEGLILTW